MGAEPSQFAAGALKLVEAGFDVIDINFGCPVKKVLGRCRGGFHLGQPETAIEIIGRTRDAVPDGIPLTVKMRRGMDDSAESRDNFFKILESAFQIGIDAVTVHGRTVKQRYVGPSRWEFLKELKQQVGDKIVLGSGDLFTAQDCLNMIAETGVDGVTVARGAIGNPWIFGQCRALANGQPLPDPPGLFEQRDIIREHFRLAEEIYTIETRGDPLCENSVSSIPFFTRSTKRSGRNSSRSRIVQSGKPCWTVGTARICQGSIPTGECTRHKAVVRRVVRKVFVAPFESG